MTYYSSHSRGFVALVAILIFSTILLIIVVSLSRYGVMARFALLDIERKTASETTANACVSVARIMVVDDPLMIASNIAVPVKNHTCVIESIVGAGIVRRIKITAEVEGATTNYLVDIEPVSGSVTRMIELTE